MKMTTLSIPRRPVQALAAAILTAIVVTGCTGYGGGSLAPAPTFTGRAVFGFSFSCERSSRSTNTNAPTGQLRVELSYGDLGTNPIGAAFAVHGVADRLAPDLESAICIGQEPPPGGNELIILGTFRKTSGAPVGYPTACPQRETGTGPLCRFEVIVRDNDGDRAPSAGDFFSIKLTSVTDTMVTEFPPFSVFYARAGFLTGGNLRVD
jgi:hypothetical protein